MNSNWPTIPVIFMGAAATHRNCIDHKLELCPLYHITVLFQIKANKPQLHSFQPNSIVEVHTCKLKHNLQN